MGNNVTIKRHFAPDLDKGVEALMRLLAVPHQVTDTEFVPIKLKGKSANEATNSK